MISVRRLRRFASGVFLAGLAGSCAPPKGAASAGQDGVATQSVPKRLALDRPVPTGSRDAAPLLTLLGEELARNVKELGKTKDRELVPYFIGYEATDEHSADVEGSFGTLQSSEDDRSRSLDVDVRVGTHKVDNTHHLRGDYDVSRDFTRTAWLPIEDDPGAIRSVAWLTTHAEYQRAIEDLVRVKANMQVKVAEQDASDDFSSENPSVFHQAPAAFSLDRTTWEARVRKLSAPFAKHPELLESRVRLEASAETRYLVTSEGTSVQIARLHARVEVTANTIADDGMRLERTETVDVSDPAALPSDDAIAHLVDRVIADLGALRKAPVIEPYAGPAILDGRAAAVFFHEIFGHRVEGHRQKDEEEGQTFAHEVGQPVMPSFLDVFDDPSIASLNGVPLNGFYAYDDEGIRGDRAVLVDHGTLRGFLLSRSPPVGFQHSNGHGRREHGHRVVSRQGNLVVDPAVTTSPEALKQRLIAEIVRDKKPYGLRFHEITGGYTNTTRYGSQAFKVLPVMVYRIYPDGREELVRGVDLEGTPLASLSRIEAAANDFEVFDGVCGAESGWVPVSATSPSILLGGIEVTRQEKGHDRPPLLPAPTDAAVRRTQ
jgi:predicted Zn-dependent protease